MGYPEFLNIRPYMSQSSGEPVVYGLYAVLVHSGYSCHAGHYYCYVKVGGPLRWVRGVCQAQAASAARSGEGPCSTAVLSPGGLRAWGQGSETPQGQQCVRGARLRRACSQGSGLEPGA